MKYFISILALTTSLLGSEIDVEWTKKDHTQYLIYGSESGVSCMNNVGDDSKAKIYLPDDRMSYIYLVGLNKKTELGNVTKIEILDKPKNVKKVSLKW